MTEHQGDCRWGNKTKELVRPSTRLYRQLDNGRLKGVAIYRSVLYFSLTEYKSYSLIYNPLGALSLKGPYRRVFDSPILHHLYNALLFALLNVKSQSGPLRTSLLNHHLTAVLHLRISHAKCCSPVMCGLQGPVTYNYRSQAIILMLPQTAPTIGSSKLNNSPSL